ncbi:MAG: hypothetical protein R6V56_07300 [Lentisphaeria bacterium]
MTFPAARILRTCVLGKTALLVIFINGCGGSPEDFAKEKERIRAQAQKLARAEARGQIDRQEVAVQMGLKWPITKVTASYKELQQRVMDQVKKEVKKEFPELPEEKLQQQAEEKYPAKKIGEEVSILIREGKGSMPQVQGAFLEETDDRVKIGNRWFLKEDIKDTDLVMFDEDFRRKKRRRFILLEKEKYAVAKKAFMEKRRRQLYRQALVDAGYQKWRGKYVPAEHVLEKKINEMVEQKAERRAPKLEAQMLKDAGFVLKDGQWKPSLMKKLF